MKLFSKNSNWCTDPEATKPDAGNFFYFRRQFEVEDDDAILHINISASNRYNLYLNGVIIGRGPCRSDIHHYNYETYKIPVNKGRHVLCAHVCEFRKKPSMIEGYEAAPAEMSCGAAFISAGGVFKKGKKIISLDSPGEWRSIEDKSIQHRPHDAEYSLNTFCVIPPLEEIDFSKKIQGLHDKNFDDSKWNSPLIISPALHRLGLKMPISRWWLTPREIPMMEEKKEFFKSAVKSDGIPLEDVSAWLSGKTLRLSKNTKLTIDAGVLTTAFPEFNFKGGEGAAVIIRYSEALFKNGVKCLMRDDPQGEVFGYSDKIILSGDENHFSTFWFRTFRFLELDISLPEGKTLEISQPSFITFMYPFKMNATFETGECEIRRIWDVAWRTARLCAHEHYYDCPYYEQLQYVGDTRIQALISYALTGDDRLGRQAIKHFDRSRLAEGITQSRYPSSWTQIIPGFSLYWIMMLKDHYDYFGDADFVREIFPGVKAVLAWFERYRSSDGLIGHLPYWNFTDWLPEWPHGNPGRDINKPLTINNMQYAYCCRIASELAPLCGEKGTEFAKRERKTIEAINKLCKDKISGLYLDMPGEKFMSQHTNAWAIICGAVKGKEADRIADEIKNNPVLSKATLYFRFYLFRAWEICRKNYFWDDLQLWRKQLDYNLSTFPETPENTRSDCHAWSASPLFEFINCALGIKASGSNDTITIAPIPSPYQKIFGSAPIKNQQIKVEIEKRDELFTIKCNLMNAAKLRIIWPDGKEEKTKEIKSFSQTKKISI